MAYARFQKHQIAQAIALCSIMVVAGSAHASCTAGTTQISAAQTSAYSLCSIEDLTITSAGSVTVTNGPAVYANNISAGSITNNGVLTSTNYEGLSVNNMTGTIVNAGTISGGLNGIGVTASGGLSSITNSGTITGNTNALSLTNGSGMIAVNNTGTLGGTVWLGINTLNLNGSAGVVDGVINGEIGSIINVNGTLNRTSTNAIDASNININSAGVLHFGQNATVNGTVVGGALNNSGTLGVAPGVTVTVGGTYTQAAGGTFKTDVASNTSYGKLLLNNSTTLPGSAKINVNVIGSPTLTANTVMADVIKVGSGTLTSSTFDVTDNSSLFNFRATQRANSVDLTVVAGTSVRRSVDDNKNSPAQGMADEIDRLASALTSSGLDTLITELGKLSTAKDVSDAVKKLLPLMVTSVKQAGFTNVRLIERVIQSRIERNHGLSAGDEVADRQFWVKPVGAWADQSDLKGVSGFKSNSSGIVLGADSAVSAKVRAGAAMSYTTSQIDGNASSAPNSAKVESYRLIGYGSYNLDEVTDIHFQADVGMSNTKGVRTINFAGATNANSDYQSTSTHVSAGIGRSMQWSEKTSFTPSVSLSYSNIQDAAYTETGAGALNLKVGSNSAEEMIAAIEGKLLHELSDSSKLSANVGVGYDFLAKQNSLSAAFAGGGGTFTTNGLDVGPWSTRLGMGYISTTKAMEITARYDLELRDGSNNQTLSVKFRMPF